MREKGNKTTPLELHRRGRRRRRESNKLPKGEGRGRKRERERGKMSHKRADKERHTFK